jgi:hypothetical protein
MKSLLLKTFLRCVVLGFLLCVPVLRAALFENGLKSAIVEYQYETTGKGSNVSGTKTVWIDDYGRRHASLQKEKSVTKVFGMSKSAETETLSILEGDWMYVIDLKEKTGMRMRMSAAKNFAAAYMAQQKDGKKNLEQSLDEWLKANNGHWIENQTILGHSCKGYEVFGMKQWVYQQVHLKMEGTMMGFTNKEVATRLQENVSIKDEVFRIPEGIKIQDAPDMSALMGQAAREQEEGGRKSKRRSAGDEEGGEGGLAALMRMAQQAGENGGQGPGEGDEPKPGKRVHGSPGQGGQAAEHGGLGFDEFKGLVAKVKVTGLGKATVGSEEGTHTAVWSKGMMNSLTIAAGGYLSPAQYVKEAREGREGQAAALTVKQFTKKGRPAVYTEVGVEGSDQKGSQLMVFDAARRFTLMVISQPARPRSELEDLLTQMGF